jgi:hypothetical protein
LYITGTPTTAGSYTFTIQLSGGAATSRTFTIVVGQAGQGAPPPQTSINQQPAPNQQQGQTGYGRIQATLNGDPWIGPLTLHYRTPSGAQGNATVSVPADYPNSAPGNHTFSYISGGPSVRNVRFNNISIANGSSCGAGCGTLTANNTGANPLSFTFNFTTVEAADGQTSSYEQQKQQLIFSNCYGPTVKACKVQAGCDLNPIGRDCYFPAATCVTRAIFACGG